MDDDALLEVLDDAVDAVRHALTGVADRGLSGQKPGQYLMDLAADAAAVPVLVGAGLGVMSEESGLHHPDRELWVALDPVDGSTNASHGLPWFATSLCVLDREGPLVALVVNLATGQRFDAIRGRGARCDGEPAVPSGCRALADAVIGVTACPPHHWGWRQVRALGAAALDICAVASGALDAYADCSNSSHAPWDYLAAALVCAEAGAHIVDARGRDLVTRAPDERRTPVAAATAELLAETVKARSTF